MEKQHESQKIVNCFFWMWHSYSLFGKLRSIKRCGPVAMMRSLLQSEVMKDKLSIVAIGQKVKHFFSCYARNRHKMTILTPSYHAENYSPDDNRFDHRQILYPNFEHQYRIIDEVVARKIKEENSKNPDDES